MGGKGVSGVNTKQMEQYNAKAYNYKEKLSSPADQKRATYS